MGMLFLSAAPDPRHSNNSRSASSLWRQQQHEQQHQQASSPSTAGAAAAKSEAFHSSSSNPSSFPHSAPDLTMTVPSSSPAAATAGSHSHPSNPYHTPPSSPHRRKKRTSQFLLFLGCLVLVLFLLRKDERRVVVLVRDANGDADAKRSSKNNNNNNKNEVVVVSGSSSTKDWSDLAAAAAAATLRGNATATATATGKGAPVGNHRNKNRTALPIRQISILGERNSGTRWTYDHMNECFGHAVHVTKRFTRYKHWFQYPNYTKYPHDTLVLSQFRNPYDWLKAMEHVPHHSPNHLRTRAGASVHDENAVNDWKVFLTKPWTMPRVGADLLLDPDNATCQEDFHYRDIVSCVMEPLPPSYYNWTNRYSEHQPFYEMRNDGSGLPYDNLLELRTDKIRNFLSTANYPGVADLWVIQYEYLLSTGTQHLVDRVAEWTGIKPRCDPIPPQNRKQKKSRYVSPEFAAHVRKHLNWTVESWIGYEADPTREQDQAW